MNADQNEISFSKWIERRQSVGIYHFTREEAFSELKIKPNSFIKACIRLQSKKKLVRVHNGFLVIVTPEYAAAGIIPVEWFIDALMKYVGGPYYIGLLSAAVYHGAAHQRPETYHIVTSKTGTRKISCGNLVIRFFRKKHPENTFIQMLKCPAGYIPVSTPEETAFDILSYSSSIGGLDRVLTVLKELGEKIDPVKLLKTAKKNNCISLAQRLGWLIDQTDFSDSAEKLAEWIKKKKPRLVRLDFHLPSINSKKDNRWNVYVNTNVESDI